jgi:DNA-binding NarL/FixJ family response regulator
MVLEPDEALRRFLCAGLAKAGGIAVTAAASDTAEALRLLDAQPPDVLLYGLGASPARDLQTLARVFATVARTRVMVLSGPGQEAYALEALRLGALAHLEREALSADDVTGAIRAMARGEAVISPRLAGQVLDELLQGQRRERRAVDARRLADRATDP